MCVCVHTCACVCERESSLVVTRVFVYGDKCVLHVACECMCL